MGIKSTIENTIKNIYNKSAYEDYAIKNSSGKIYEKDVHLIPLHILQSAYGCAHPTKFVKDTSVFILDAGCGQGCDLFLLSKKNKLIYGIDFSIEMLKKAKKNVPSASLFCANLDKIPFQDNFFDTIISNAAVHLCLDKLKVFKEFHRILKESGEILIGDLMLERGNSTLSVFKKEFLESDGLFLYGGILSEHEYFSYIHEAGFDYIEILEKIPLSGLQKAASLYIEKKGIKGKLKQKILNWTKNSTLNSVVFRAEKKFLNTLNINCPSCHKTLKVNIAESIEQKYVSSRIINLLKNYELNYISCKNCEFQCEITIPFVFITNKITYHVFPSKFKSNKEMIEAELKNSLKLYNSPFMNKQRIVFGLSELLTLI